MNIYIDVEIRSRELDAKLLLGVLAASRGHKVLVSHLSEILLGFKTGILAPGIFHTTNLAPTAQKISRHESILKKGSIITSMDEEGGLPDRGYDKFAKVRYSDRTIEQSAAVFGWGSEDTESLKKIYKKYSSKIHSTGSPRADLWKTNFINYWGFPKNMPKRPYLLVSSNMYSISNVTPFYKYYKYLKDSGYSKLDPDFFLNQFKMAAEDSHKTGAFINAINYLANNNNGFDIVLRPHPVENVEAWKVFLEGIDNVYVIHKQSITPWVNNAFAIMHNGCTTAIEATISGKPVITFIPFEQQFGREIPNELGYRAETLEELSKTANSLFNNNISKNPELKPAIPDIISKKFYFDKNELAAEKILKVWEGLDNNKLSNNISWFNFNLLLKFSNLRKATGKIKRKIFPSKFEKYEGNHKFPKLEKHDIYDRVNKMCKVLSIKNKIKCDLISHRTILIKRI
tara:strand:+ start:7998 stop:9368 length:1371 start_codon:yes stop_codon:yes gene_type:complete